MTIIENDYYDFFLLLWPADLFSISMCVYIYVKVEDSVLYFTHL